MSGKRVRLIAEIEMDKQDYPQLKRAIQQARSWYPTAKVKIRKVM